MVVKNGVFDVIVLKKIVPNACIRAERIMEYEFNGWIDFSDCSANPSVVVLESWQVRLVPRLICWLECIDSWMMSPFEHQVAYILNSPINVFLVDCIILLSDWVVCSHPVTILIIPMIEMIIIIPMNIASFTRVVKPIL